MKFISIITNNIKKVAAITVVVGAILSALTAFTDFWEKNAPKEDSK
jgi:hypothetical protein